MAHSAQSTSLTISVIIPTHNRADTLRACLTSVTQQSLSPAQTILVDDGSTDDTVAMVRAVFPNVTLLEQANAGPASARNRGFAVATTDIVAFTDDDCVVPVDWLERLVEGFRRRPDVTGVGGALLADKATRQANLLARYEAFMVRVIHRAADQEVYGGFECPAGGTNNIAFRSAALRAVGGFDESFRYPAGEDADLKWRLALAGARFLYTPVVVTHLQHYTWSGFRRQHFTRGQGQFMFDRKWNRIPSRTRIAARVGIGWLRAISRLPRMPEAALLRPALLAVWYNALGQWRALREAV